MSEQTFEAYVVEELDGEYVGSLKELCISDLPDNELLIRVHYSALNYKDALSASGNKGVTRNYPHTPGIDAAGTVISDASDRFQQGDEVIVTSYDLGMNTHGGFGEYIRVPAEWAVALPSGLDQKESMIIGTAGFTAAQSVHALMESTAPQDGEILVTGATGGVGSMAVAILSKLGYSVTAVTGKPDSEEYLRDLGANEVVARSELLDDPKRPILKVRWAGVIDCVGGDMLVAAIKMTRPLGTITCCGMVGAPDLPLSVFPFILRGVRLIGIDSQSCPMPRREILWNNLADTWKPAQLDLCVNDIDLQGLPDSIQSMLGGQHQGRTVVSLVAE